MKMYILARWYVILFLVGCLQGALQAATCQTDCSTCVSNNGVSDSDNNPHSFFNPRSVTDNNMFQDNLALYWWYHEIIKDENCSWWFMHVSPLYQRSTDSKTFAKYFLPCAKSCMNVAEGNTGDFASPWINLLAANNLTFDATVSLRPERSVAGAYFDFRFDTSRLFCDTWFEVSFSVLHVKHDFNFCETDSTPGVVCDITNVAEGFNQSDWLYGKFPLCSQSARGVDLVQFKFGYDWFFCDDNHLSPYLVGTAATGLRNDPYYLFQPIVNNKHGSIGTGVIGEYLLYSKECSTLNLLADVKYRYGLPAIEKRSFDLCQNGALSRYIQVVCKSALSNSLPGINLLTQDVTVTPGSTIDAWFALHYERNQWNGELGYDFWWRAKEKIELCYFPSGYGVYDLGGDCAINAVSASTLCISLSNIATASDATFVEIAASDLNLNSGASPKSLSNTVYAALGYNGDLADHPAFVGVGGSYERAIGHTAMSNWAVWARFALAF